MAKTEFKGRHAELRLLDELWNSPNATLLILYGRRRVGKTRLLTHWMGRHAQQAIYWVAEPTSALDQLRSFSQTLFNYSQPDVPAPLEFSYATWEQALQQAAALAKEQRLALFIDEVTYLLDVMPSWPGVLQKMWDHHLSKTNLILALSGSQMGLMQNLLAYEAPLYGRAAAQIKLPPLPFDVTAEFFPNYSPAERVKYASVIAATASSARPVMLPFGAVSTAQSASIVSAQNGTSESTQWFCSIIPGESATMLPTPAASTGRPRERIHRNVNATPMVLNATTISLSPIHG